MQEGSALRCPRACDRDAEECDARVFQTRLSSVPVLAPLVAGASLRRGGAAPRGHTHLPRTEDYPVMLTAYIASQELATLSSPASARRA